MNVLKHSDGVLWSERFDLLHLMGWMDEKTHGRGYGFGSWHGMPWLEWSNEWKGHVHLDFEFHAGPLIQFSTTSDDMQIEIVRSLSIDIDREVSDY